MDTKILIEPIINKEKYGFAVQAKKFSIDLQITNKGTIPSPEFTISKVDLRSAQGQDIVEDFGGKSFLVKTINPEESEIIRIGETGQFMYGLVSIRVITNQKDGTLHTHFCQMNPFTHEISQSLVDTWVDFFYIKSTNEFKQERSTNWMIGLTIAITILTIAQVLSLLIRK